MGYSQRRALRQRVGQSVNHANGEVIVEEVTNIPVVTDRRLGTAAQGPYNPPTKATFQMRVLTYYFTESSDVYTERTAAYMLANAPTLATSLPIFMFCNLDYNAGYPTFQGQFPINIWAYNPIIEYGKNTSPGTVPLGPWDATVTAKLRAGDLVFPYTATLAGPINYMCIKVVRVTNVPYATLIQSTSSNLFGINMIRYVMADDTAAQLAQAANPIMPGDLTMFGMFTKDTVDPEVFKNPEQQQKNIIDIYYDFRVSKQKGLGTYVQYDVVDFRLNFFVAYAEKIN